MLVPLALGAEIVVGASVSKSLYDLEITSLKAKHEVELGALKQTLTAEQVAREQQDRIYREQLAHRDAWHRSPLLWFGLGVATSILIGGVTLWAR